MTWLQKKITALQNKPYSERLKILRRILIGIAVILLLVWLLTLRYRNLETGNQSSGIGTIWDTFKKLKDLSPPPNN